MCSPIGAFITQIISLGFQAYRAYPDSLCIRESYLRSCLLCQRNILYSKNDYPNTFFVIPEIC
jgi:hypothetical protein